eukprot:m.179580 g.179580  ORF g.179580 m.179580 type:complete len:103 (-) comp31981_c0_seq2:170-478(-)
MSVERLSQTQTTCILMRIHVEGLAIMLTSPITITIIKIIITIITITPIPIFIAVSIPQDPLIVHSSHVVHIYYSFVTHVFHWHTRALSLTQLIIPSSKPLII